MADTVCNPIDTTVRSVQRRMFRASLLDGVSRGVLVGVGLALAFAAIRSTVLEDAHWTWIFAFIGGGALGGLIWGANRGASRLSAARLIDEHYDLKDRSITTLDFVNRDADPASRLQIEEAAERIEKANVTATDCVPLDTWNQPLRWSAGLSAVMAIILLLGSGSQNEVEAKPILALSTQQSAELRETMLPELEEALEETDDPEIEKLLKELREKVEEMETEIVEENDLMATLSEMEQALAEAREAMQLEWTDATMKALASAIKPSDELKNAAASMESEDYEKASEQLEAVDPEKMGDKQRRAVADNLKKMLAKLDPGQNGQLSETISQLAEGLESKNTSQCKKCLGKLAGQCKKQGQCKKIGQCMSCQLNRLAQCKGQCRGQCNSNIARKSNSPSTKAGKAASGQPLGSEATKINSSRTEEQLTGVQGEGPSETEILQAPEGEQQAARKFAGNYDEYKRQAEAVLNSEPLPMGHRETVRNYFEAIRPNSEEATE
ncbi:MAG: hypothetical protein AAFX06_19885 [Planctomycetota bacterium]